MARAAARSHLRAPEHQSVRRANCRAREQGSRGPDVGAVLLGAGLGTVAGAALGAGTAFAVVYGTNNNGCYMGGCDAPLLSAIGFSIVTGTAGALAGATVGGLIGSSLSE